MRREEPTASLALLISMQRVVVTGVGAITPLGVGMERCFQEIVAGKSGIVVCVLPF